MRYIVTGLLLLISFVGISCSTNVPIPEANVSLLRVKLIKLQISEPSTDHNIEKVKYTDIARRAENIHAYYLAASANSMLAKYYENLSVSSTAEKQEEFLNIALKYYQRALYLDKKEQELIATSANPFPNSDKISISLNNISYVFEQLGDNDKAIKYAERAYQINRNLEYNNRVVKDCERLSKLYKHIGNKRMSEEYVKIQKEYEILVEKQKHVESSDVK